MIVDPKRVREIFLEAADLPDEATRAACLDKACGADTGLRQRVEALLRAHDPEGSFLGTPAAVVSDPDPAGSELLEFLAPAGRPDSLGRIGHYEILQVLGMGGFGIVFRALDITLQRVVAVKVLSPQIAATSPARKRFLREAQSSAAVRHENVVQLYEIGEKPLPYLVMEFIPGETLQERLDRTGPLDVPEVLRIGRQIAAGLVAAHDHDLIHRDIKPGNILLESGPNGQVKITDFGLARAADDASLTQSGVVAGTPNFMAPEQALGLRIDQRADLFSLGSVLYTMVSGRPPFRASSMLAVLKRVAEESPRAIPEIIPETPEWLCAIIAKLHAKNPADRYQSAREVAALLADCEAKLKARQEIKHELPVAKLARRKWIGAAAILLLPAIALAMTELAGVTHLFRGQQATTDPIKPDGGPTPGEGAKKETPDTGIWTLLKPIEMKSEGGATLKLQDDGSILAAGEHPAEDIYSLTCRNLPAKLQALRLEVLPHTTLPGNGPGRYESGEFILTRVTAQLEHSRNPSESRNLKLVAAWADNSRSDDSEVGFAIDTLDITGWVTEVGKPHFAVFELAEPVSVTEGMVLRVTLEFKHEIKQNQLGCFRLSVTPDANAAKDRYNKGEFK